MMRQRIWGGAVRMLPLTTHTPLPVTVSTLLRPPCRPATVHLPSHEQEIDNERACSLKEWNAARPFEEMPGPRPLPIIGNVWRFIPGIGSMPLNNFSAWISIMNKNYGKISKFTNIPGRRDLVFLFDSNDFETVYRNEGQWPLRLPFECFPYYRNVTRKDFFQGVGGLLTVNGEEWQKFRTFVNPVMLQPRNAKMFDGKIDEVTTDFMNRIPSWLDEMNELPANFSSELKKWSLESIALIALDTRLGCLDPNLVEGSETDKIIKSTDTVVDLIFKLDVGLPIWKFISTPSWRKFVSSFDTFTEICTKYITIALENIKNSPNKDENDRSVLEKLLLRDPDPKKAIATAMDMMFAGIDTTSYTVASVLYQLSKNPDKQEALYREVKRFLPEPNTPVTAEKLEDMKYLKACIKETNRMVPIVIIISRNMQKDVVVGGYQIPKGTDMVMCHSFLSNTEESFPQANSFLPERWIKNKTAGVECSHLTQHKPHPFAMMPFGFGKRNCVGMRFANLEMEILVSKMIRNYRMEYHYGEMEYQSGTVYMPVSPLRFRMLKREG